jgi:hypothetical protein
LFNIGSNLFRSGEGINFFMIDINHGSFRFGSG